MKGIYILGDGAHANVLRDTLIESNYRHDIVLVSVYPGWKPEGDDHAGLIVGIGVRVDCGIPRDRIRLFKQYEDDYSFITVRHPTAFVSQTASIGMGVHIEAFAYVGPHTIIGDNCLINVGAQVNHDTVIGDHTVLAPGAKVMGACRIGERCCIGTGATIVQMVELGNETRIPAQTLVVGRDDFRKPVRMVRGNGKDFAALGALEVDERDGEFMLYHCPAG